MFIFYKSLSWRGALGGLPSRATILCPWEQFTHCSTSPTPILLGAGEVDDITLHYITLHRQTQFCYRAGQKKDQRTNIRKENLDLVQKCRSEALGLGQIQWRSQDFGFWLFIFLTSKNLISSLFLTSKNLISSILSFFPRSQKKERKKSSPLRPLHPIAKGVEPKVASTN